MYNESMNVQVPEKDVRKLFIGSLIMKGLNAVLEILGAILLSFTGTITGLIEWFARRELIEDPTDFAANLIEKYLPYLSGHTQLFASFYLLSHGVIKLFLVIALLKNKLWAYPTAIIVFFLFIAYQLFRFTATHSIFLIFLIIFDLVVIWLTLHEYREMKRRLI
jgi:uncharacterized membrane protein